MLRPLNYSGKKKEAFFKIRSILIEMVMVQEVLKGPELQICTIGLAIIEAYLEQIGRK